jgi:hypothetical protein
MTLDQFAEMTRRVIADQGFDEFQPTACFPERRHVKSLAGLPDDIDPEQPVLEWAMNSADENEEFLVAFKIGDNHFRVVRPENGEQTARNYPVTSYTPKLTLMHLLAVRLQNRNSLSEKRLNRTTPQSMRSCVSGSTRGA